MASIPAPLRWRGIVEGFYGPPWTAAQRRAQLRFAATHGLNLYLLAAKDDPFHRARWREPYPAAESTALGELAAEADRLGIGFVVGLAPGLDWRTGDDDALAAKAGSLAGAGVPHVALLFDDLPGSDRTDAELGEEHGRIAARFADRRPPGDVPLLVCPADYAGIAPSAYREGLARTLPPTAVILWSGPAVVSAAVTSEDVNAARQSYGRDVLLWDNVPVNDFDRARAYCGPLRDRPAAPILAGILANGLVEPAASRITLATVAEYARDPAGYDPAAALARALQQTGDAELLAPLAAMSNWPPDADTGLDLLPAIEAARAGRPQSLRRRLAPLAAVDTESAAGAVAVELRPWLRAGRDLAVAGLAALDLLAGAMEPAAVREGLDRAEGHWPNVARDVLSPFVRSVLPAEPDDAATPYAWLVAGGLRSAGEERLAERLRRRGLGVRRAPDPAHPPALVVVSRSAEEEAARAAAGLAVPLLALFHLVPLGLATTAGVLLREEHVVITAPDHPLAGGWTGRVRVHRGPAMSRWGEPGPGATVIARAEEEPRPVITHYPAGALLADGRPAPAARAALFLGRDLLAPWVATHDAVALVDAAIRTLLA